MSTINETWYRYEYVLYGYAEDYFADFEPKVVIELRHYRVTKVTEQGIWVRSIHDYSPKNDRFILLSTGYGRNSRPTRKRFAHPNKEEALISFLARKRRQQSYLVAQLENVTRAILIAEEMEKKDAI